LGPLSARAAFLFLPALLSAQPASLLPGDPLPCFSLSGTAASNRQVVDVEGQPFSRALRLRTPAAAANPWNIQARCTATQPATLGDTLLATFYVRSVSAPAGHALVTFILERNRDPWTKSAEFTVGITPEWRRVQVPFGLRETYPDNGVGYAVGFFLGHEAQEIEIGGITLENHGPNVPFGDLNLTDWPYPGRAPDAPWREAAAARIEQYRKGDLVVTVTGAEGHPISGATVKLRMKRHAFGFGTAVNAGLLSQNTEDARRYREALPRLFNKTVIENHLKWPFWETWGRPGADFALDWLPANSLPDLRGHVLVWPGKRNLPPDVVSLLEQTPVDQAALRARINSHIAEITAYARGRVTEWDVLNEPFDNKDLQAVLGDKEMAEWFRLARLGDPDARLYINDYDITEDGGYNLRHIAHYYATIEALLDNGAPLDGIGLQSHFNANFTPPERVLEILDRFASFEKDLMVTEFDINIKDEDMQAAYTRDYLTICFSHPAMKGFLMWGFWAGAHWLPDGAMIRRDWSTKPNYDAWVDLVYKEWWTNTVGTTGD
jgi:GH35 family endo-1,4-beta-xylanase